MFYLDGRGIDVEVPSYYWRKHSLFLSDSGTGNRPPWGKDQFSGLKICSSKYQIYMFYKDTVFWSLNLGLDFYVSATFLIDVLNRCF